MMSGINNMGKTYGFGLYDKDLEIIIEALEFMYDMYDDDIEMLHTRQELHETLTKIRSMLSNGS